MRSLLAELRSLAPQRPLTPSEARFVAERQALKLLAAHGVTAPPVPQSVIADFPRIQIEYVDSQHSGLAQWYGGRWFLLISARESRRRAAFSQAHELKHVIDHRRARIMYPQTKLMTSHQRAEKVCNEFAASLLMPKIWIRRAWTEGIQDVGDLASLFEVSKAAMRVRLQILGLVSDLERSAA